jgi:hypothetical protein
MQKLLIATATALIVSGTVAAHASPITVKGSYTVTQSNPTGNEPTITDDLSSSFTESLTYGISKTTNFISVAPAGSSGTCGGSKPACNSTNDTATDTIKVTFSFTLPTGGAGDFVETGTYIADYDGTAKYDGKSCTSSPGTETDCVVWSTSNDPIVVSFSDGDTLDVTLNNAQDWTMTPTITFLLTDAPSVPEPASIAIFGTALTSLIFVRRRRKAA